MPVIMGRKSYEALKKSLPGRINIVVTNKNQLAPGDVFVVHTISMMQLKKLKKVMPKKFLSLAGVKFLNKQLI